MEGSFARQLQAIQERMEQRAAVCEIWARDCAVERMALKAAEYTEEMTRLRKAAYLLEQAINALNDKPE